MAKRIRIVTARDQAPQIPQGRASSRVVVAADNPKPSMSLTMNEIRARKLYATTSTMGGFSRRTADTVDSGQSQFYSPQLSTDFLEKPQNLRERRAFYRFFYNTNEIVRAAVDIHTTLPLSKLRLVPPKGKNKHQNQYVFKFFQDMCDEMKLFKTLIEITHEYNLFGTAFCYAEQADWREKLSETEVAEKADNARQRMQFLQEKYQITDKNPLFKGWSKIIVLPPDQVRIRKLPLSDEVSVEYQPDAETRKFLTSEMVPTTDMEDPQRTPQYTLPEEIREKVRRSGIIPMDTDPNSGSHVYVLSRKKSQYEPLGVSMVEPCVNTLVLLDKLRQAQTSIASRHMTPMRIVWAEDLNNEGVDNLREQVDMALVDPDYSIIANYEIHWEEMGSQGRLLDIENENEAGFNRLCAGLNVTREILTGEGTYTGSKINLEIMNTQYLLYREIIQDYVENNLFKPVARKKGFVEYDDYGNEVLLYPKLSFTRLAIRDNETYFDAAFQLYQKGSVSIDLILDILNIDPDSTREKIEKDLFTVNDSIFNEVLRNIYTNVSQSLVEKTDITQRLAQYLHLGMTEAPAETAGASRFSSAAAKDVVEDGKTASIPADDDAEKRVKLAKLMKYFSDNPQALNRVFGKIGESK